MKYLKNGLTYIVSTYLLLMYIIKGKKLEKYIKILRDKFSSYISSSLNINRESISKLLSILLYIFESIIVVLFIQYLYLGNFTVPTGSMKPKILPNDRYLADMVSYKFFKPKRGQIIIFNSPTSEIHFCKRLIALPGERVRISFDNKLYINNRYIETNNVYYNYTSLNDGTVVNSPMNDTEWLVPKRGDEIELKFCFFRYFVNGEEITKDLWEMRNLIDKMSKNEALKFLRKLKRDSKLEIFKTKIILNSKDITGIIMDEEILLDLIKGKVVNLKNDYYFALGDNSLKSEDSRYWGFIKDSRIRGRPIIRWWPLERVDIIRSHPY